MIATAPTRQQLYDVLWAEIAKWLQGSKVEKMLEWTKTKVYMKGYPERWFATAKTATRPENMQGFHEDYMLFVIDEASGLSENIMEAIFGTLSGAENKLLMCGNPTRTSGAFYDSHNRDRDQYKVHKIASNDQSLLAEGRTSKENIAMLKRKYGEGSDVYRVRVLGDFPKAEADTFIPLEVAEHAAITEVKAAGTILDIGVDVARFGDDETVITVKMGGKVYPQRFYFGNDTMETAGNTLSLAKEYAKKHNPKEVYIKIDDSGVGGGVTDRLNEVIREERLRGYKVFAIINNGKSNDDHYENAGTEQWAVIREVLDDNLSAYMQGEEAIIDLPNDEKLISQLTTRKYKMTSRGRIALERKEDMKKRGLQSPDRADSLALAFYRPKINKARTVKAFM